MSHRRRPTAPRPKHRLACRPAPEAMESRQLLTAVPVGATFDFSRQNWADGPITLAPMYETQVKGVMPPLATASGYVYGDRFEFSLQKGEVVDLSLHVASANGQTGSTSIGIYNLANGATVDSDYHQNADGDVVFEAPATGTYQASVHTFNLPGTYTANVREIALDPTSDTQLNPNHSTADANKLDFQGGALYAWLNGRSEAVNSNGQAVVGNAGTSLSFSGPTGRGFTIDGHWTESRNPINGVVTYTGTGNGGGIGLASDLTLEMANPLNPTQNLHIPISIGNATGLVVTVGQDSTNDTQGLYGPVTGTRFSVANVPFASQVGSNANISSAITSIATQFGETADLSQYGASIGASNNLAWGISLGTAASQATDDLPANPAVPYIWFAADAGNQAHATFGNVSASVGQGMGFSALVDPADPSFCLAVDGLPVVPKLGVGGSINGLIPYMPNNTAMPATPLWGDVYFAGSLDLGSLTDETVPIVLDGDVTLDLDPNHYGLANIAGNLKADFDNMLTHPSGSHLTTAGITTLANDLKQVSLGLNGTASLGITAKGIDIEVPLGYGSVEWDGMTGDLAFAAGTIDPLGGTPLSFLTSASSLTAAGDINFDTDHFNLDLDGSYGMLGQTLANADVNFRGNYGPGGAATFTVTGSSHISIGFGSISTAGAWADAYDQISFCVDTTGYGSMSVNATATATAGLLGYSASGGYSYGYSAGGNIVAMITAQYQNMEDNLGNWDSTLANDLVSIYTQAKSKVEAAWDSMENWFESL